jgi:hypothetical protein
MTLNTYKAWAEFSWPFGPEKLNCEPRNRHHLAGHPPTWTKRQAGSLSYNTPSHRHGGLRGDAGRVPLVSRSEPGAGAPPFSRVGDDNQGLGSLDHTKQGALKRFRIERSEAFVENDHLGLLQQRPGDE